MEGEDTKQSRCEKHGYQKYSWQLKFDVSRQHIWRHFQYRYRQTSMKKNSPPPKKHWRMT